jgi:hypothetical protein
MSDEVAVAPKETKKKKDAPAKKEKRRDPKVHMLKGRKGEWGGSTWCGINFRRKNFFEQVQANSGLVTCDKCLKEGAELVEAEVKDKEKERKKR